jgi:hypothetical protein
MRCVRADAGVGAVLIRGRVRARKVIRTMHILCSKARK